MRDEASAASQPACPAPITATVAEVGDFVVFVVVCVMCKTRFFSKITNFYQKYTYTQFILARFRRFVKPFSAEKSKIHQGKAY
jgi:hypothetical protein